MKIGTVSNERKDEHAVLTFSY